LRPQHDRIDIERGLIERAKIFYFKKRPLPADGL